MTDSIVTNKSGIKPDHLTMEEWVESRIARFEGRKYDWNALKFRADFDEIPPGADALHRHRRNRRGERHQHRAGGPFYLLHHGAAVEVRRAAAPARRRGRGVLHAQGADHADDRDGDNYTETVLRERDLISVPPGIYRGLFNHGEEEALMCVMLGTNKPEIPTYPSDHPLSKVKRN